MFSNLTRKADKYGNVHFISFYSAVLSRLAYFSDTNFLEKYASIFGPVINENIMKCIDSAENIPALLDDESIFKLNAGNPYNFPIYMYDNKRFVEFIDLAKKINVINNEVNDNNVSIQLSQKNNNQFVKYISIATSNYGEIYIIADKRMPNTMFLVFRGTYSGKTAAAYTKPSSLIPLNVGVTSDGKAESYLFGIFKITIEVIHTIIESMRYLATNFLNAKNPDSIKLITTGHSLGGAMCTNFAYLWMKIPTIAPYNSFPYNVISKQIGCFSLGAPRSVNSDISELFCQYVSEKKITFLRITTRGDPVPAMPFKATYYSHPCSDSISIKKGYRQLVSEDCNGLITMRPLPNVNYNGDLDCQNYKTRTYIPNPISHTIYLDILYTNGVDIKNFATSTVSFKTQEITRDPKTKSTKCRIILYDNGYKAIFFDMNNARGQNVDDYASEIELSNEEIQNGGLGFTSNLISKTSSNSGYGIKKSKTVVEDININENSFNKLINDAVSINISPLPMDGKTINPFNSTNPSPNLCCVGLKQKGGNKYYNYNYKKTRTRTSTRKTKIIRRTKIGKKTKANRKPKMTRKQR